MLGLKIVGRGRINADGVPVSTFLSSHPEEAAHQIAIFARPEHKYIAFQVESLADLRDFYRRVLDYGLPIKWAFNHTNSLAFYFSEFLFIGEVALPLWLLIMGVNVEQWNKRALARKSLSHVDNENAADYLRTEVGQTDGTIEWAAVRPDNLIDESAVTAYEVHTSPIRDAIFAPGQTSRINVGHFMADLITDDDTWNKWKGQMPVIYNKAS